MKNTPITYHLLFTLFLTLISCFHNPGIVLQLPTNYSLPIIQPQLPQQIPSILLQKLQLTNVNLRQVQYKWRYQTNKFIVLLQRTVVSFNWVYGHDAGFGTFIEQYTDLVIICSYGIDSDYRFKVDIQGAKITNEDKRHNIKISLGGGVPETITVQVTNLILNHAKNAFRSAVKGVISKIVQSFTEPLRKDFKVICVKQSSKQHCIYINTTLVAKPTQYQNAQLIQINGAPYIDKNSSGFLDPSEVMFKVNSTLMNIQVSRQFVNSLISMYLKLQPIDKIIKTTEISSVADIDSQTLTVVFPGMDDYGDPRPVLLGVHVVSVQTDLGEVPYIGFIANCTLKVQTQYHTVLPYLEKAQGTVLVKLQPIINLNVIGARIKKITIKDLQFNPKDIQQNRIDPPELIKHLQTLMTWTVQGSNGALNQKKQELQFIGVSIYPKISLLKNSINVEMKFMDSIKLEKQKYAVEQIL